VVAKLRERLAVNKQRLHSLHIERFNLKKLNKGEGNSSIMLRPHAFAVLYNILIEFGVSMKLVRLIKMF
jgi:hypothetical protein